MVNLNKLTLGIESTCDETGCAIVRDGKEILSNVISSQIDLHMQYGGVVPELACRRHIDVIIPVLNEALKEANITLEQIDQIAVAQGPGLVGALLVGVNCAKALAWSLNKPLIPVNHIEAHLYAASMSQKEPVCFPCLGAVLSGGHTSLVYMPEEGSYELIGQTLDDAIGEAFDKVAKILNLPYPGGPRIEILARGGNPQRFPLKTGQVKNRPFDFSFSGLKTGVLYTAKGQSSKYSSALTLSPEDIPDLAASFQQVAFQDIIKKTIAAARLKNCSSILFGGGVTANQRLREMFVETDSSLDYYWPEKGLILDNAAMIAGLGYRRYLKNPQSASLDLEVMPNMPFLK